MKSDSEEGNGCFSIDAIVYQIYILYANELTVKQCVDLLYVRLHFSECLFFLSLKLPRIRYLEVM